MRLIVLARLRNSERDFAEYDAAYQLEHFYHYARFDVKMVWDGTLSGKEYLALRR